VELPKKGKERKINNEKLELRSKRFLHKVNTIYLFLKKQAGYKYFGAVTNAKSTSRDPKRVLKIDELRI